MGNMAIREFRVTLPPTEAMDLIKKSIIKGSVTGKIVDSYAREIGDYEVFVFILEKFYMRASRASLTVTIDNFEDVTKVHAVASGGSEGILPIDWGAGKSFVRIVENTLRPYLIVEE
ncbi:DUF6054 family protein [Sporosarcina sp. G11-34]|uniref:DUF6054 family protein n=1 Tax=Sporosarcina sp. G11-34 TaxID=2849605 RepID=UPI0022A9CDDC|nr:DUF6054 family protein [Sporosarcina sp. G11-34]MCZ2260363.1 hypothetical protein [Sporosarcina sp. G11-34]